MTTKTLYKKLAKIKSRFYIDEHNCIRTKRKQKCPLHAVIGIKFPHLYCSARDADAVGLPIDFIVNFIMACDNAKHEIKNRKVKYLRTKILKILELNERAVSQEKCKDNNNPF